MIANRSEILALNSIRTPDGTVLTSKYADHHVCYKDKNGDDYAVGGGSEYLRRSINDIPFEELSIYADDEHEKVRTGFFWGTRGIDGKQTMEYKSIMELSCDHIDNILMLHVSPIYEEALWEEISYRIDKGFEVLEDGTEAPLDDEPLEDVVT